MEIILYREYGELLGVAISNNKKGDSNPYIRGNNIYINRHLNELNNALDNIIENSGIDITKRFSYLDKKVRSLYSKLRNTLFDIACQKKSKLSKDLERKVTLNYEATCILIEDILKEKNKKSKYPDRINVEDHPFRRAI
tara:strand:- start:304 stop:720 length:417 start_codon:yes stop_codon:yes gene_type:complete